VNSQLQNNLIFVEKQLAKRLGTMSSNANFIKEGNNAAMNPN